MISGRFNIFPRYLVIHWWLCSYPFMFHYEALFAMLLLPVFIHQDVLIIFRNLKLSVLKLCDDSKF